MPLSTEEKIQDWLRFVQRLGQTDRPQDVAHAVIHEGIRAIGADGGFMSLLSPSRTELTFAGSYAYAPEAVAFLKSVPLTAQFPFVIAFTRREALFLESLEQARQDYPDLVPHIQNFHGSVVDLPLVVGDEALGVLVLSFAQARSFTAYERVFLRVLAAQCAQALQRSGALHQERRAREQAEALQEQFAFLAAATQTLTTSLDLQATLDALTRLAVPRLADWCAVFLPRGTQLVPVAVAHEDPARVPLVRQFTDHYPVVIEASGGLGEVYRSGTPQLVPTVTEELLRAAGADEAYLRSVRALQIHSMLHVPLTAHGRTAGVLSLATSDAARTFSEADLTVVQDVARRAALAVENAHLYATLQEELAERRRAQQAVTDLNAQLERRVEERTQALAMANANMEAFTYTASHDLRTPVRHVRSFADLLQRRLGDADPRALQLLQQIQEAASRMDELTQGLLDLARVTSMDLDFRPVDLGPLMQKVIEGQAPDIGPRQVQWMVGALPVVQGDERLIRQVFENLVGNAVKYTRDRAEARIEVHAEQTSTEVVVKVADNGVGFDPRWAGKLFGVFQRLNPADGFEGTGVGLATVQRIMHRHGGRVWADGVPGGGATFCVAFPRTPVTADPAP